MTLHKAFKGTGFDRPYTKRGNCLFVAVYGGPKVGKTHFTKGMPPKIAYQGIDYGHSGVIDDEVEAGTLIPAVGYEYPAEVQKDGEPDSKFFERVQRAAGKQWKMLCDDFQAALDSDARTLAVDTGTELYEIMVMARCGKLVEIPPLMRGKMKREFGTLLRRLLQTQKSLAYLATEGDVWKGNKPTDATKPEGFAKLGHYAETVVRLSKKKRSTGYLYQGEIMDCRLARELEGEVVEDLDFWTLVEMIWEARGWDAPDPEEWGY
jgi:hypothetical protein